MMLKSCANTLSYLAFFTTSLPTSNRVFVMGRHKPNDWEDSSDSDSSEEEIEFPELTEGQFTGGHRRKRQRTSKDAKESAALGVFGSDSEDDAMLGSGRGRGRSAKGLRNKGVGFVKSGGGAGGGGEDDEDDEDDDDGDIDASRLEEVVGEGDEVEGDRTSTGGLGLGSAAAARFAGLGSWNDRNEEPSMRSGLGLGGGSLGKLTRAGLGTDSGTSTPRSLDAHVGLGFRPSAASRMGSVESPQPEPSTAQQYSTPLGRGFVSSIAAAAMGMPTLNSTPPETRPESAGPRPSFFTPQHSSKTRGRGDAREDSQPTVNPNSFAAKMMAKMGYVAGQGLGRTGEGILDPIEVKLRPQGLGVGAIKEKTEQARREAKRAAALRGEALSDSEEEKEKRRAKRKPGGLSSGSTPDGTPLRARKAKTRFRTADEISASAKGLEIPSALKNIVDFTGKEKKLLTSASGIMAREPSAEDESLKIATMARKDLESFAGEWKSLQDRKKQLAKEEERLDTEIYGETEDIRRLKGMVEMVKTVQDLSSRTDPVGAIVTQLEVLQLEYQNEIEKCDLAGVAVAALYPFFKQGLASWSPLSDPFHFFDNFRRLRRILQIRSKDDLEAEYSKNGYVERSKFTTHYESMIFSHWLPKVRSAINNDWDVREPAPVLLLLDIWTSILPPFVHANILDQLVLPKLRAAVTDWNPRVSRKKKVRQPPHLWVFQWLPHLGSHMTELLRDVRRKFGVILKTWEVSRGTIEGLEEWKEVFEPGQLDDLLVRHVLPRLALRLRDDFDVNPADQQLEPLEEVFKWIPFFKISTFAQLVEVEFFPKWLNILYRWLTADPILTEVQEWYVFWQDVFPEELRNFPAIRSGFKKGLDMMNSALDLGQDASVKLTPPAAGPPRPVKPDIANSKIPKLKPAGAPIQANATFRDVVEDWCAEHNLLLVPMRKAHETTGIPLFRITASASGSGGLVVYFQGDVVWVQDKKNRDLFEPLGLDQVRERAEGSTR